ncbi:MAG: hypothetical protein PHV75_08065 [Victivallaceae bacterium]|nr:hypothetical protein [Victivallaceae bacterium]
MNKKMIIAGILSAGTLAVLANQQPTSNNNPAYGNSKVEAQLRLNIKEGAEVVHFIRDTNDPKVITKTYVLKHADPYSIRPYLREMVQTTRVNYNNATGRGNTDYYNQYSKDNAAKTQKIFVNTGIECVKFSDGTGVIMVSAEDYRFKDNENGMGIDSLVAKLDVPNIKNSSGGPKYIYFPARRPANELQTLIKLVGANVSNDTVELIGGKDKVEVDEDLNCLFFNTALYSRKNIEDMLRIYDVSHPEVRISCTVYELDSENDGMLGLDFQSWKNNDGVKFLSTGAGFSRNYNIRELTSIVAPDGTVNTHYFNFEPKWNSKFLDFLVSKGKAKVVSNGELTIQNGSTGKMERKSGILYAALTPIKETPNLSDGGDIQHGNEVNVKAENHKFRFFMEATPSITENATTLHLKVGTVSMLGYTSTGAVRTTKYDSEQKIMLGNGKNRLYLGGIDKSQVVSDVGGVPLLKDIPLLGWFFSTERESTKKSKLIVVADCEIIQPDSEIDENDLQKMKIIRKDTGRKSEFNRFGYRQYLLDNER